MGPVRVGVDPGGWGGGVTLDQDTMTVGWPATAPGADTKAAVHPPGRSAQRRRGGTPRRRTPLPTIDVGVRIPLADLTRLEMDVLAGRVDGARETVDEVYAWTDGQPYVTQRVCVALQEEGGRSVAQRVAGIVERLFLRGGPTSDGSLATAARLRATELLLTGMVARSPGGGGGLRAEPDLSGGVRSPVDRGPRG